MVENKLRKAFKLALYSILISFGFTLLTYFYYKIAYTPGILWKSWERGYPFPYATGILQSESGGLPIGIIDFSTLLLDSGIFLIPAVAIVLLKNRMLNHQKEMR